VAIAGMGARADREPNRVMKPNGLANGRPGAHIRRMEKYRSHMLEVKVSNHPPQWKWEVSSNGEMIANGFEREQIAARFEGYNAMFLLLAAGWNP
jgi:hypothetical protein